MRSQPIPPDFMVKVNQCLDTLVSETLEAEIIQEIRNNPSYLNDLSREKAFRKFIQQKLHRKQPAPQLIQSIKERIRLEAVLNPSR